MRFEHETLGQRVRFATGGPRTVWPGKWKPLERNGSW
jgi:hypothetical protein